MIPNSLRRFPGARYVRLIHAGKSVDPRANIDPMPTRIGFGYEITSWFMRLLTRRIHADIARQ